jgi:hypothetical protein
VQPPSQGKQGVEHESHGGAEGDGLDAYCRLLIAYCLLPVVNCLLQAAYYLLPAYARRNVRFFKHARSSEKLLQFAHAV